MPLELLSFVSCHFLWNESVPCGQCPLRACAG